MHFILNARANSFKSKKINQLLHTIQRNGNFDESLDFLDELTNISIKMMKYKTKNKEMQAIELNRMLNDVKIGNNVYSPLDQTRIIRIVRNSGKPLLSHAKFPFMVSFEVERNDECYISNIIFKAGDDCRQDQLALQLKELFLKIFSDSNLSIFLYPYKVVSTNYECGVIEVIPNALSRHQLGKDKYNTLVDYFSDVFGFKEGKMYKEAKKQFILSFVGYSLFSYFLNVKDRHNANIMINNKGQIIHIDFGYMFEIAPGGIHLEIPLKITDEIYTLLKDNMDDFEKLMIQGFFALRRRSKEIVLLAASFQDSDLPCYNKYAIDNLIERFKPDLSDAELKVFIRNLIYTSIKKIRTYIYDKFQHLTNDIAF